MNDLTKGPVLRHLLSMGAFIGVGLVLQTLYFLIDLYFVSRLGNAAVAGVASAGNLNFLGMALSQIIAVGAGSLIAQAAGRKDAADAALVLHQSMGLALAMAAGVLVLGYGFADLMVTGIGADAATTKAGHDYLYGFLPSMAFMFPTMALSAGLRGAGVVRPTMLVQSGSVLLNAILAPVLISGWGTGVPLGTFGAGLASSIAAGAGLAWLAFAFGRAQAFIRWDLALWAPRVAVWRKVFAIGLPAAGEFGLMFLVMVTMYWAIAGFGAEAQAGFAIGMRVMQSIFLPAMAVAFATAPIVGQNFGAGAYQRIVEAFVKAVLVSGGLMFVLGLIAHMFPAALSAPFTDDQKALAVAVVYLKILSWNFVASGVAFVCSGVFQGLGNTKPALFSSASRIVTYVLPVILMARVPGVQLEHFFYVSVASVTSQALLSLWLLRREFRIKGIHPARPATAAAA